MTASNDGGFSAARYLPRMVRRRLAGALGPGPIVERFEGAVLFTDIVGFSRLTANFAAAGPEGAERLSALLDSYFGRMTDIVSHWGGDVTDFVSDSIVAVWPHAHDADEAVQRAAACALELQRALGEVVERTALPLRQRVSVGSGVLTLFVLGDGDRGHWLLTGQALRAAAETNYRAEPGDVLLCTQVRQRLGRLAVGTAGAHGELVLTDLTRAVGAPPAVDSTASLLVPEREADLVSPFVPRLLLEQARAGQWPWPGEFRNVTVLFLGLAESDVIDAAAVCRLRDTEALLHHTEQRYGGTHLHFFADEKGVAALSVFGLPQAAFENDVERALGAALELIEGLLARGIAASIGVATGRAFYSDSGGSNRRRLGLVGEPVNLAARLMGVAHGRVLCDAAVRQSAPSFGFTSLAPMTLKGIGVPVAAFEPCSRADWQLLRFARRMVGRNAERMRIAGEIAQLRRGTGGLLVVNGEAGIGKSRLLADAVRMAQSLGVQVLIGAGSAMEPGTPYFPWRRLLAQLLPSERGERIAFLRERLRGDPRYELWLPLLEAIVPLGLVATDATRNMDSASGALAIQELICELLTGHAAVHPLLLVLDDLHWADAASCSLLQRVADRLPHVLIAVGARPADQAVVPQVVNLLCNQSEVLSLDSLDRAAVGELVRLSLGVGSAPAPLLDFLWARAGGHPFYVEELLLVLRSLNLLTVSDGVCRVSGDFSAAAATAIPATVRGLIVGRFDRLHAVQQRALKLASVIGREFALEALGDLEAEAAEPAPLQPLMATLVEARLLRRSPGAGQRYEFRHAILRDVIYELLPFAQRRELHRRVAIWIESCNEDLRQCHAELAMHWERAGEIPRALQHLECAAVHAVSRHFPRDAIAYLQHAQSLVAAKHLALSPEQETRWQGLLGDAHHGLFEHVSAACHFRRSLSGLGRQVPTGKLRMIGVLLRELLDHFRRYPRPMAVIGPADDGIGQSGHVSRTHERLAEIAHVDDRALTLLYHALASLNLAERSGAVREKIGGAAALSIACLVAGLRRLAHFYNRRSLKLAAQSGVPADRAHAHLMDMVFSASTGRWDRLESSAAIALPIFRRIGASGRWHQAQSLRYHADSLRGHFARARRLLAEVRAELARDTPTQVRSWILCSDIGISLACDAPQATALAALAEVLTSELHRADRVRCLGLMSLAWLRLGEPGRALTEIDAALAALADGVPTAWYIADGLVALAETCIALVVAADSGNEGLRRRMRIACAALSRYTAKAPLAAPRAALVEAQVHGLRHKWRAERAALRRALASSQQFDMPYSEALALRRLAGFERDPLARQALFERADKCWDAARPCVMATPATSARSRTPRI